MRLLDLILALSSKQHRIEKRTRPPTQPTVLSDDCAPRKRPRRATKETWKAREARKARETLKEVEAERSQTSSDRYRKKQASFVYPDSGIGEVVGVVDGIVDVYLGEDGSIQCLVTYNLVDDELRRRCEELFCQRYGHQELRRRAAIKPQIRKK
ncbi:hypothetical protein LTR99_005567 [Exophiala xenobiotica]|nr:hypothetical protein LTR47_007227 [Exophiala xenobiotica]KAK5302610.1 hypothetical protein LTR99_005567 [Exophiala xenobiotica]KAK5348146.1 hypothetical protein LTR61_008004 [Exophiala xenobiotica]KAK5365951.1 hypothetical protein LTS03_008710 [Exophiala xenobiotica]